MSDILTLIGFKTGGKTTGIKDPQPVTFLPYYPGIRAELDLNISYNIKEMIFHFRKSSEYSIDIQLDDSSLNTWRPLIRHGALNIFVLFFFSHNVKF